MTPATFRRAALSLPEAVEQAHQNHPDFRVGKRVFATLGYPSAPFGMVKLTPVQQAQFVAAFPEVYSPVPGGWGRSGSTRVHLKAATLAVLRPALFEAWRNIAPARLTRDLP